MGEEVADSDGASCPVLHYDYSGRGPALSHLRDLDDLRGLGPIVRSTHGVGFHVLTDGAGVREAMRQPQLFSSSIVIPFEGEPPYKWIPEMLDPPEHTKWRQLLAPHFTPQAVASLEEKIQSHCGELLDGLAERGSCDFLADFAWKFPTTIFLELMGLPVADLELFLGWEDAILHHADLDPELAVTAMLEVMAYFQELIGRRRQSPTADLLGTSLTWEIDDAPIADDDLLSWCLLMFMAGLDTVSIQLGYTFWHLAQSSSDRALLAAHPDAIPAAVEEFLRAFSFVAPGRKLTADTTICGQPLPAGAHLLVPLAAACRDPGEFDRAEEVLVERSPNAHVAFGVGPHRCLGSHLARLELRIALEEWHTRIPDYRLDPSVEILEHGVMFGLDRLALRWD